MRKLQKVQATAGSDSRLGRRWETAVANLLIARGVSAKARQVLEDFGHEADLVISLRSGDCVISVAHVKQRNPKEKYYRLLDELALFKQAYPNTKKVLLYAGDFLAEKGWKDVLEALFDSVVHVNSLATPDQMEEMLKSDFSGSPLSKKDAASWVEKLGLQNVVGALSKSISSPLKNTTLWSSSSNLVTTYENRLKNERDSRIRAGKQTELRRPLLAAISIPPDIRNRLGMADASGVRMDEVAANNQEKLGTLTIQSSVLLGASVSADPKVALLIRNSPSQISAYEADVRSSNKIYASYLDDLHCPSRIEEMVNCFADAMPGGKIDKALLINLIGRHKTSGDLLPHSRPTVWVMEVALAHAKTSRNELDKKLAARFPQQFPNARNVTGRYIYGDLRGSKKMSIVDYEDMASAYLDGTALLSLDEVFSRIVEDRRYAIAVIQNPKPLESLVRAALEGAFPKKNIVVGPSQSTLISKIFQDVTGKKAGRLGVVPFQYSCLYKGQKIVIRALSGFDRANINHKLKELAAKMAHIRLLELANKSPLSIFIAILDGHWNKDDHEALIMAGYDYVCSTVELPLVLKKLKADVKSVS